MTPHSSGREDVNCAKKRHTKQVAFILQLPILYLFISWHLYITFSDPCSQPAMSNNRNSLLWVHNVPQLYFRWLQNSPGLPKFGHARGFVFQQHTSLCPSRQHEQYPPSVGKKQHLVSLWLLARVHSQTKTKKGDNSEVANTVYLLQVSLTLYVFPKQTSRELKNEKDLKDYCLLSQGPWQAQTSTDKQAYTKPLGSHIVGWKYTVHPDSLTMNGWTIRYSCLIQLLILKGPLFLSGMRLGAAPTTVTQKICVQNRYDYELKV